VAAGAGAALPVAEDDGAHGCRPAVWDPAAPRLAGRAGLPCRHALAFGADGGVGCQGRWWGWVSAHWRAGRPLGGAPLTWSRHAASRAHFERLGPRGRGAVPLATVTGTCKA
jgi:hypothetical protein